MLETAPYKQRAKQWTLPLPPTTNSAYRAGINKRTGKAQFFSDKDYRNYKDNAGKFIPVQSCLEGECMLRLEFYFARPRDIDSGLKCLLDTLQGRIYANDSQITALHLTKKIDKENPRVVVSYINLTLT